MITLAEQIKVMQSALDGKVIQCRHRQRCWKATTLH